MKKEKNCKKGKENLVGKIIYSFLLFAPLLSILATCVYTIINENAKDSYYGQTINEEISNQATNTLYKNVEYTTLFNTNTSMKSNDSYYSNYVAVVKITSTSFTNIVNNYENIVGFDFYNTENSYNIRFHRDTDGVISYSYQAYVTNGTPSNFYLTYILFNDVTIGDNMKNSTTYLEYNKFSYMDNVFEYSIYKIENNDLYNWAKTTGTYTVVSNTAQLLGITNTFIPMLLTYWLIISIIYIIYDIGLIMIWIAHNKVHELVESV